MAEATKQRSEAGKAHDALAKLKERQAAIIAKDPTNDTAMRKVIAISSDMDALERIAKRAESGWYEAGLK